MLPEKSYLFVFISIFSIALFVILALNLALGERGLGSAQAVQQASAWQQSTRGITYAPPVTNSRPFKAQRLADRVMEINTVVLGASSLMGVTEAMFPASMRAYNFSLTANATATVAGEAEYIERRYASRVRNLVIGLDWAIGMIYLPGDVTTLDLTPAAQLSGYGASTVSLSAKLADALSLPKVVNLGSALRAALKSGQPLADFRSTFFDLAGLEYRCAEGAVARDFDVVGRGTCLGFRYDGSWTFAGERHLSEARAKVLAQAAAAPSSQFSKYLCSAQGEPNSVLLRHLGAVARRFIASGGNAVFILPPLIPGMEQEMTKAAASYRCLARTKSTLDTWARETGVTIIDAAASEAFGCKAEEFLDENHAWPECHARILGRYWSDRARGAVSPGLYHPAL
ncbi:MAG TPA: hypothetical protein VK663_07655 [Burkholderiales bacterium]|nr:hypothetical protein [Burkholderiales bacterium]